MTTYSHSPYGAVGGGTEAPHGLTTEHLQHLDSAPETTTVYRRSHGRTISARSLEMELSDAAGRTGAPCDDGNTAQRLSPHCVGVTPTGLSITVGLQRPSGHRRATSLPLADQLPYSEWRRIADTTGYESPYPHSLPPRRGHSRQVSERSEQIPTMHFPGDASDGPSGRAHGRTKTTPTRLLNHRRSESSAKKSVAHAALSGSCEYRPIPSDQETQLMGIPDPNTGATTDFSLFFGQCRFEMTPRQMMWLVLHLTQGTCVPTYLHPRGTGCFTAYFQTQPEADYVRGFHECLLCDHNGVWLARSEEERARLQAYIESGRTRFPRLPRGAMIIRE